MRKTQWKEEAKDTEKKQDNGQNKAWVKTWKDEILSTCNE